MVATWHAMEQIVDREYAVDVREYRDRFAAVDRRDPAALRGWFHTHRYLTGNDLARIAGVSLRTVGRWRRAAGLPPAARNRPAYRRPRPQPPAPPADWRDGRWLADQYPAHSVRQIARAVGRSYTWTRRRLLRLGVRFPDRREAVRSRHACSTLAWLFEQYVVRGLSLTRCARLAGVSRGTMSDWLLRHRLRVRSNSEQQLANYWINSGAPFDLARPGRPRKRRGTGAGE